MNYELKAVRPLSVLINAFRVFIVIGFIAAIYSFFISPYSGLRLAVWWQKIAATLLFTIVYAVVVSCILALIALLYNFWANNYKGISLHLEQEQSE